MDVVEFTRNLNALLRLGVPGLSAGQKLALIQKHVALWQADETLLELRVAFVPFVPGRRPKDEILSPGLGSSDGICVLGRGDRMIYLYRLERRGKPLEALPEGVRLQATLELLDADGNPVRTVPGWDRRDVKPERQEGAGKAAAFALVLDVEADLAPLAGGGVDGPFGFASLYSERFRIRLELRADEVGSPGTELEFAL